MANEDQQENQQADLNDIQSYSDPKNRNQNLERLENTVKSKLKSGLTNRAKTIGKQVAAKLTASVAANPWVWGIGLALIILVIFLAVVFGGNSPASSKEPRSAFEPVAKSVTAKADLAAVLKASPDQITLPDSDKTKLLACQSVPESCQIDARVIGLISLLSNRFDHIRVSIMDSYDPATDDDVLSREQDPGKQPVLSAHSLGQALDVYELGYAQRNGWMDNIPVELGWARSNDLNLTGEYSIGAQIGGSLTGLKALTNEYTPGSDPKLLASKFAEAKAAIQAMPELPEVLSNEDFAAVNDTYSGFLAMLRIFRKNAEAVVPKDTEYCWDAKKTQCLTVNWTRLTGHSKVTNQARWAEFWAWMDADFSRFDLDLKESRRSNAARKVIKTQELALYERIIENAVKIATTGDKGDLKNALALINSNESLISEVVTKNSIRATGRLKNLLYLSELGQMRQTIDNLDKSQDAETVQQFYDVMSSLGYLAELEKVADLKSNDSLVLSDEYWPLSNLAYLGELKYLDKLPWGKLANLPKDPEPPDGVEIDDDPSGPATLAREAIAKLDNLKYLKNLRDLSGPFPAQAALWSNLSDLGNLGALGDLSYILENDPSNFNTGNLALLSLLGGHEDTNMEGGFRIKLGGKGIGLYALGLLGDPPTASLEPGFKLASLPEFTASFLPADSFQAIADLDKTISPPAGTQAIIDWSEKLLANKEIKARNQFLRAAAPSLFYRPAAESRAADAINFVLSLNEDTLRPRQILGWQKAGANDYDPAFPVSGSVLSLTVFDHLHFGY